MSIWGKIIGGATGFAFGGPIGALLGGVAGHAIDKIKTKKKLPEETALKQIGFTIGEIPSKNKVVIYAIKHQSAWETVFCTDLFSMPSIVLKKPLIFLPVIGLYFLRSGAIPITRDQGINALKKMGRKAKQAVKEKRSMMIFPQGTRVNPGVTTKEKPYLPGVFFLYSQTKVSVIPVAHNAGLLWPKNSFIKYPNRLKSKSITIKILPEIQPGLSKLEFLQKLETIIEDSSNELIKLES